jgi:hypothetical protein
MKTSVEENQENMVAVQSVYTEKIIFLEDLLSFNNSNYDINTILNIHGDIFETTMDFSKTTLFFDKYCQSAYNPALIIICNKLLAAYASGSIIRDLAYGKLVLLLSRAYVAHPVMHALDTVLQERRKKSKYILDQVIGHQKGGT